MKLRKVKLFGKLAKLCGTKEVELVGNDIRVIVSGLTNMFGMEVKEFIKANNFRISVKSNKEKYNDLTMDNVTEDIDDSVDTIRIMPVVEGSGGKWFNIIVGIILVVVAIFYPPAAAYGAQLIAAGASMIVAGLTMPSFSNSREDRANSFVFNQPNNVTEQGQPVNIVYGRFRCGSLVASSGMYAETRFGTSGGGGGGGSGGGGYGWTLPPIWDPADFDPEWMDV